MANRLANATSPYLLQHAENPVDWWEWCPEAFEEARRRDVPILLSVGYAACHWCHVMAHESFEDEATAAYLNEHFVSIKVDREERPDIDAVYMQATVAMTGQGGWPMTCVLDHEGVPFFAGTYFPLTPRPGMASFQQVLAAVVEAWRDRGEAVSQSAAHIKAALQAHAEVTYAGTMDAPFLEAAVAKLAGEFDQRSAGFGGAPKFPPTMVLDFLMRQRGAQADTMVNATLQAMARGGINDQLAGGFARYSVDADWVVPHFEKMLYDNAQLLGLYARAARVYEQPEYADVAHQTADFMIAELGTAQGAFASALDADSEGAEGTYYVWTPQQLREVLGDEDGAWAASLLSVTQAGTFEHGSSTLQLRQDPDDPQRWQSVRHRLSTTRAQRVRPERDDKVVAAWNGLAISGLVDAAFLDEKYLDAAIACGEFLRDQHLRNGRLLRVSRDGVAGPHAGVLEDYACVAKAFCDLAAATADGSWLDDASELLERVVADFAAPDGGFFDTAAGAEELIVRPRDLGDNASPSGHSAMIHACLSYVALTGSTRFGEVAERAIGLAREIAAQSPRFAGHSLAAATTALNGPLEIAIIGAPSAQRDALESTTYRLAPVGSVVVVAEAGQSQIPLLLDRSEIDGRPTAYVCRQMVCQRPVTDPAELADLIGGD
ncbi:MAG: thioredoxin domain-containing protein [Nocardioidaceae bacterium]